ncbi:twin-arginine translocation signal domain-containing protein [Streptomyces niveus]|uniref:twin-arginine translocation signal domain-containing protein n=1 Tax=Streptomyces niveus TaxID=193462 RepID=UPI0033B49532
MEPLGRRGFLGTLAAGAAVLGLPSLAEAATLASSPTRPHASQRNHRQPAGTPPRR